MVLNRAMLWMMLAFASLLATGCGGDKLPRTAPVDGVLKFKGAALGFYQVDFFPEDSSQRPAGGVTDESGKFILGTNAPGDGAVVGKHKVAITYLGPQGAVKDVEASDYVPPPPPKVKIPAKYEDASKSQLTFDVPANGLTALEINLQ